MSTTLTIQILIYMAFLAFIAFAWGYSLGHREGLKTGRAATHKLYRRLFEKLPR